eukprot:1155917-Pelagomonas_calceolata.AAC.5
MDAMQAEMLLRAREAVHGPVGVVSSSVTRSTWIWVEKIQGALIKGKGISLQSSFHQLCGKEINAQMTGFLTGASPRSPILAQSLHVHYCLGANRHAVRCLEATYDRLVTSGDDGNMVLYRFN